MKIVVCPLSHVEEIVRIRRPSHLITLLDPDHPLETPAGLAPERHFKAGVHDIAETVEGLTAPDEALVERLIGFGRGWSAEAPMLIHCWAGISRSTATAFTLACDKNPSVAEVEIAREMRRRSPHAWPNRRIVAIADLILGRRGRMVEALEAMGEREIAYEGEPFELLARW
jgi:predicted protein tyrosine phosphatase